ncbi:MAG TPA: hypothetical protein PKA64_05455 [Myxococcota bacterium]|nr:hypothetical protein [Myxococcota bacterium]
MWEQIVRLEREGLEDGDLRAQARAFKDDWLSRHRAGLRDDDLLRQWEAWKSRWRRSSASP